MNQDQAETELSIRIMLTGWSSLFVLKTIGDLSCLCIVVPDDWTRAGEHAIVPASHPGVSSSAQRAVGPASRPYSSITLLQHLAIVEELPEGVEEDLRRALEL